MIFAQAQGSVSLSEPFLVHMIITHSGFAPAGADFLSERERPLVRDRMGGSALGFRNLTNYIARSLLESGGFRPRLHPGL